MRFSIVLKEKISRVISDYFTTNQIVNVFTDANIPTDKSLFAKWRIVLDAFNKMSDPEAGILSVVKTFTHPLNFADTSKRNTFIKDLNKILSYENVEIQDTDRGARIVSIDGGPQHDLANEPAETKTSTDHIVEALNFFKNEYNKVKISGLTYKYPLGENFESDQVEDGKAEYDEKLTAINQLHEVGFVKKYEVEAVVESDGYYIWDYAMCKIDESKLFQKEAPQATPAGVEAVAQKVVHEHTHRFENSIQEKEINLTHNLSKNKKGDSSAKFPYKVPAGTKWESILIQFTTDESANIQVAGHSHPTGYADMGFIDNRTGKPNLQWGLLIILAKNGGSLPPSSPDAEAKYKKQKQLLSEKLCAYFNITSDPFKPYGKEGYSIRATLIPPSGKPTKQKKEKDISGQIEELFTDLTTE